MNIPFISKKNTINKPLRKIIGRGFSLWSVGNRKYNDAYLWIVIGKIFGGLRNITFYSEVGGNEKINQIIDFFDTNKNIMLWELWSLGFIVLDYDKDGQLYFPPIDKVRKDIDGAVLRYPIVFYSDKYQLTGKSDFRILADNLVYIDQLKNADEYLTTNFGTLGIMSSKELPFTEADKDDFYKSLQENFGITSNKRQLLLFNSPVDFKQMRLPISELQITEKLREEIKLLAGFFNVPYDLIPFSGASTYANQEQAVKSFYTDCVSPLAEQLLKVLRFVVLHDSSILLPTDRITFRIENVPELEDDRNVEVTYQQNVINLIRALDEIGEDSSYWRKKLNINK